MVQVAVYGMRCIYLNNDTLKILGTHFSHDEELKQEKYFYKTARYSASTRKCKMKNFALGEKRFIF